MTPNDFANLLASNKHGHYQATLRNPRAIASYVLQIAVPDDRELAVIDELFLKFLGVPDVTVSGVRRFSEDVADIEQSRDYADALSNYVFGILAKDQTGGTTIPLKQFTDKLQDSLEVLKDFERPIPKSLTATIRLNLNDFGTQFTSGNRLLDDGLRFFHQLRLSLPFSVAGKAKEKRKSWPCPIDSTSETILRSCESLIKNHLLNQERLSLLLTRGATTEQDRAKIRVMLAVEGLVNRKQEHAKKWLKALSNDEVFGSWANESLKELEER